MGADSMRRAWRLLPLISCLMGCSNEPAVESEYDAATKAAIEGKTDEATKAAVDAKIRLAIAGLERGDPGPARELLASAHDPLPRTTFIDRFPWWIDDVSQLAALLEKNDDPAFRSGMCLALGGIAMKTLPENDRKALQAVLLKLYTTAPDTGTHSAAGWALRQWQVEMPTIEASAGPVQGAAWYVNSMGMTMLKIPAGELVGTWLQCDPNQLTKLTYKEHRLRAERPFYIGDCEVTADRFHRFIADPDTEKPQDWRPESESLSPSGDHPARELNWFHPILFCNWLSKKEKLSPCYRRSSQPMKISGKEYPAWSCDFEADGYRLPTEVEWEYACRAQTTTDYCCGDSTFLRSYAVYGAIVTAPCGSKLPNAWGLFDMHGNVWEWCWDWHDLPISAYPANDRNLPIQGTGRVRRGGSFNYQVELPRSADCSDILSPNYLCFTNGFRVARTCR